MSGNETPARLQSAWQMSYSVRWRRLISLETRVSKVGSEAKASRKVAAASAKPEVSFMVRLAKEVEPGHR